MVEWFYRRAGQIVGPLTAAELREHASAQMVAPTDHVRRGGDGQWVLASKVKGLFVPAPGEQSPAPEQPPSEAVEAAPTPVTNSKLTDCPDCGKSVSRRAEQCPHCGCPIGNAKPQAVLVQDVAPQVKAFDVVVQCVVKAVRDLGYTLGNVDKQNGIIAFKTGISLWTFGQDIKLVVVDMGKTFSIDMTSRSGQLFDWGESKQIGRKIVNRARKLLEAAGLPDVLK